MALTLPWRRTPPAVIDAHTVTLAEQPKRTNAPLSGVGVTGVVSYGGVVYHEDYDRAWQGDERDRTIRRMLDSPNIGAALSGIEMLIRRVDWQIKPADDSREAQDIAYFIESNFAEMQGYWPGETLARILTYLGWGWSAQEIIYKQREDGRIGWERWRLIPQFTRYGWEFDDRGDPTYLIQLDPQTFRQIRIPVDRCLLIRYGARDNSPEGATPLRVAFDAWYFKSKIQVIEGIGIERDLGGLPIGRVPAANIEARDATYTAMQDLVTGVRVDSMGGLVLASDRDQSGQYKQTFELASTGGQRAIDTDKIVRRYANEELMVLLANVMRTGQDGTGSYALAETQGGLFQQGLGAHLDTIADAITEQAIKPLIAYNPDINPDLMPTLEHGDIESADLARLGKYLTDLATAGMLEDTPELRAFVHELAGLPVPSIKDMEKSMAEDEKAAEQARQDALKSLQTQQQATPDQNAENGSQDAATAQRASEVLQFTSDDGTLTLSDIMAVKKWWDSVVDPEHRGLLDAKIVTGDDDPHG